MMAQPLAVALVTVDDEKTCFHARDDRLLMGCEDHAEPGPLVHRMSVTLYGTVAPIAYRLHDRRIKHARRLGVRDLDVCNRAVRPHGELELHGPPAAEPVGLCRVHRRHVMYALELGFCDDLGAI